MAAHNSLDVLVFAAHPDDAEIGMGGTIAKHVRLGWRVGICDLTLAELSSNGDVETRQREAEAATEALGLAFRTNLAIPDRGLNVSDRSQLERMVNVIRECRPRFVFAPYVRDRHPDHVACGMMAKEAVFNAKLRKWNPSLPAWNVEQFYYYFINDVGEPDVLIDVSDVYGDKLAALEAYRSQFTAPGEDNDYVATPLNQQYVSRVRARDSLSGQSKSVAFAEGFVSSGPILLTSLQ